MPVKREFVHSETLTKKQLFYCQSVPYKGIKNLQIVYTLTKNSAFFCQSAWFILLNSVSDFSLQGGLINERITFSHWHKPIAAVTPGRNHDIIFQNKYQIGTHIFYILGSN